MVSNHYMPVFWNIDTALSMIIHVVVDVRLDTWKPEKVVDGDG